MADIRTLGCQDLGQQEIVVHWLFSKDQTRSAGGSFHSLFEIACRCAKIVPFLALPPGATAMVGMSGIVVEWNGERFSSHDDEMLRRIDKFEERRQPI